MGKFFKKENIDFSLDNVTARNLNAPIYDRVIDDNSKMRHLDESKIREIIQQYEFSNE